MRRSFRLELTGAGPRTRGKGGRRRLFVLVVSWTFVRIVNRKDIEQPGNSRVNRSDLDELAKPRMQTIQDGLRRLCEKAAENGVVIIVLQCPLNSAGNAARPTQN